jgi:hypothetical protein
MADTVKDLKSLPLYDIIGAPISAMVQAEAQSAQTTLQFIEKLGFEPLEEGGGGGGGAVSVGALRMVEFSYTKPDANGNPAEFVARIPLLALLPIPGIRIKLATLNFAAKISDVINTSTETTEPGEGEGEDSDVPPWLKGSGIQFRGSLVSSTSTEQTTTSSFDMNIKIELEQTPVTLGIAKLINLLDLAISDVQKLPPGNP